MTCAVIFFTGPLAAIPKEMAPRKVQNYLSRIAGHIRQMDENIYTHILDSTLTEAVERAFEADKESIEESLSVCRAMLKGKTVSHIADDARQTLAKLIDSLRGLVESHEIHMREEKS